MGTHTLATMEVSAATYEEITSKLRAAGYDHAFIDGNTFSHPMLDMTGIGIDIEAPSASRYDPTIMDRIPADVLAAAQRLTKWDAERGDGKGWSIAGVCNEEWVRRQIAKRGGA